MTDNQMDGGPADGTTTNANGGASGTQGVQQPSFDAAKLQEVLDAVGTLSKRVDGLQSVKDKQANELTGLKAQITEYEQLKERLGADGALEQLELRQTLAEIKEKLSGAVSPQSPGTGASGAVNAAKAFVDLELDLKNPLVADALGKQYASETEAQLAAYRVRDQLRNSPSPTAAQGAAIQGGQPKAEPNRDALIEELGKLQQTNPLSPRIKEIEKELGW